MLYLRTIVYSKVRRSFVGRKAGELVRHDEPVFLVLKKNINILLYYKNLVN